VVRLPTVGGDSGNWGTILNGFLEQEHDADGTHGTITPTDIKAQGPWVDVRNYASINAAVAAIGATETTLLIPNAQTLITSLTIPSTLTLKILKGGSIVKASTYTLTINGPFEAGLYQVFSGFSAGDVTFGTGYIKEVYPQWWLTNTTPGTTDMGVAFASAAAAVKGKGIPVSIPPGAYYSTGQMDVSAHYCKIHGSGSGSVYITYNGTDYFIKGLTPAAVGTGYFWTEIKGMTIICGASAIGAIKLGDPTAVYSNDTWYYGVTLDDLHISGASQAGSIGLNLTQIGKLNQTRVHVSNFDINMNHHLVVESKIDDLRSSGAVSKEVHIDTLSGAGDSADDTKYSNIRWTGLLSGVTAVDIGVIGNIHFDNIFFEGATAAAVTNLFKIAGGANISYRDIHIGGNLTATNFWNITDPNQIVIENAYYGDTTVGRFGTSEGAVSITYTNPTNYTTTKDYGKVRLINCAYLINSLFAPYPGVQIFSSGITNNGLHAYNRPITGQPFSWARQILNLQGKAFMPEGNFVFSAWHGQTFHGDGSVTIVADTDCSGGYGLSLPAGKQIGPKFAYPSEIMLGDYEIIVRMKAASGTPDATITILVDDTIKHYNTFAISTTMATYSYRTTLVAGDIGSGTTVSFDLISGASVAIIIDYIAVRPFFNDIVISSYTAPAANAAYDGLGNRIIFRSAAPVAGVWNVGDICFNTAPAANNTPGWVCTTAGTPGTWKAMANLGS
jgi:hypothetical protein